MSIEQTINMTESNQDKRLLLSIPRRTLLVILHSVDMNHWNITSINPIHTDTKNVEFLRFFFVTPDFFYLYSCLL